MRQYVPHMAANLNSASRPRRPMHFAPARSRPAPPPSRLSLHRLVLAALPAVLMAEAAPADEGSPAAARGGGLLEEIVVTAQKREQNLQDIGIAVTALSGERLEALGVAQPIDIHAQVPNFNIKNEVGKSTPTLTLRGIGVGAFSHNSASPVGVYLDEVFLPSTAQMSFAVYDVERVEVLRGPQGTLFGRNTTAGAVSFLSRKPTELFEASLKAGLGNSESASLDGYISGPLAPGVAGRLAATYRRQGKGFFFNRLSGEHIGGVERLGIKASVQWDIAAPASFWAQAWMGRERSENDPWVAIGTADRNLPTANPHFPGGQLFATDCAPLDVTPTRYFRENCVTRNGYRDPDGDMFAGEWSRNSVLDADAFGGVARLDVEWRNSTLTSVTGFNSMDKATEEDFDGSPFALGDNRYGTDIRVFSQELRIASNAPLAGRTDFVAGVFYYRDDQSENDLYGYADRANHDVKLAYDQGTTSLGVFAHTETWLSDAWRLTAGARHTDDAIGFSAETSIENVQPGGPQPVFGPFTFITLFGEYGTLANPRAISAINDTLDTREFTYKVGLDYRPGDNRLLYGSYSRGYKSGGFVGFWTTSSEEYGPFDAETVDAVEAGFKSTLAGGAMTLNAALFNYRYEDAHIFGFTPGGAFTILNAGEGDFSGGEIELQWRAAEALEIIAGAGYINAELVISGAEPVLPGNSPEFTFNGMLRYRANLPKRLRLTAQTDFSWQGEVFFDATQRAAVSQDAYWLVNARLALANASDSWELAAWVRNLADKEYFGQIFRSKTAAALSATAGNPRTFGIEATLRF